MHICIAVHTWMPSPGAHKMHWLKVGFLMRLLLWAIGMCSLHVRLCQKKISSSFVYDLK